MKKNNQNRVKFISYFEMELVLLILNLVHLTSSFKACQTEKDKKTGKVINTIDREIVGDKLVMVCGKF